MARYRLTGDFLAHTPNYHIDGLMQERSNSSALAMGLCLSCTKPSICHNMPELERNRPDASSIGCGSGQVLEHHGMFTGDVVRVCASRDFIRPSCPKLSICHNVSELERNRSDASSIGCGSGHTLAHYGILTGGMVRECASWDLITSVAPFTNMDWLLSQQGYVIISIIKCGMKLLIHS